MQHHLNFLVGVFLVVSIDFSVQQTCLPTQFKCTSGECVKQTDMCDYYRDCRDNSDETNCTFSSNVDYTKALVVVTANQLLSPPGIIINLYGNPANYVPSLGLTPLYPLTNLSLPINFREFESKRYNYLSTMDVDSYNSVVLFGNNALQRIEWGPLILDSTADTYINGETTSTQVAAVAYDWIAKNVYWLDAYYKWIKVASIGLPTSSVYVRTIVQNIVNPQDIAVDPINAILFWISGACGSAQIMRSGLDGSNPTPVATTPSSNCPIKLAIDVNAQQLYWLDSVNTRVGYVSYSNSNSSSPASWFTSSAFGAMSSMTLFGNYVVLGSSTRRTVNFYRKGTLTLEALTSPIYSPTSSYSLVDIATYDVTNQPSTSSRSPCYNNNGGCSQLCFTTSQSTSICGCKTQQILSSDGTTCTNSQTINKAYNNVVYAAAVLALLLVLQ